MGMDREKVIKGLECCFNPNSENSCLCNCQECPYNPPDDEDWTQMCQVDLNRDALALIKEQQNLIDGMIKRRMDNGAFD